MYEWKREYMGYSKEEAETKRDEIINAGGVARVQYLEGMEMGSGPHFQGYDLYFISPEDLYNHVMLPTQAPVDRDRYLPNCRDETDDPCQCGHQYYRHFDSYEPGLPHIGCKYCECGQFEEPQPSEGKNSHIPN